MEWSIPYGLHSGYVIKKWLGFQPKNGHMEPMKCGWNPPIPYENNRECKDLYTLLLLPNHHDLPILFKGLVHRTAKKCRTELNQTMVWSIFWLQLPEFGAILVAGCQVSKTFQNRSKTGFNWLQVEQLRELHTLVIMFINFNWVFGSSKMVKN